MIVLLFEYHKYLKLNIDYEFIYNHTLSQSYLIEEGILGFIDNLLITNPLSSSFYFNLDKSYINEYLNLDNNKTMKLSNFYIKPITKTKIFLPKSSNNRIFQLTGINNPNSNLKLGDIFNNYHQFTIPEKYLIHHILKTNTTYINTIPNITIEDLCIYLNKTIKEHKHQYFFLNNKGIYLEPPNTNIPFHNTYYHPFLTKLYSSLI